MIRSKLRRAFTLLEVVVVSAITSVILLGMSSAMMIAAHAAPGRNGLAELTLRAGRATDQMAADISGATGFNILGSGSIELVVPDRTGDQLSETVRYNWSGVSGDPLYRTFNGGTAVAVATDVRQFALGYVKAATKLPVAYTETGESLLYGTDNGSALYPTVTVSDKAGVTAAFLPTYPAGVAYLRVTRALFQLKANNGISASEVRGVLRTGSSISSIPSSLIDWDKLIAPALLANWVEVDFTQNAQIAPGSAVAVSLLDVTGNDFYASIRTGVSILNSAYAASTDSGTTWTLDATRALPCYVYGVFGTKNADAYNYNLTNVTCSLKCGDSPLTQMRCNWRVLNAPQVTGP